MYFNYRISSFPFLADNHHPEESYRKLNVHMMLHDVGPLPSTR